MENKLYVGGLAYAVTDQELSDLCSQHGNVESATVVKDRETNNSRGFGFVEMSTQEEAEKAILLAEKVRQIIRSYFGLT